MAPIILPAEWYSRVLQDPFGLSAVFGGEKYGAPNRFFVHWFMSAYFKNVPAFLQNFINPIASVYLSCALLKAVVQVLIGWMLAAYVSGTAKPARRGFLLAAILIFPLFQNADYRGTMGVIDGSVTYTCFYALPLGLLLLFFWPFVRAFRSGQRLQLPLFQKIMLAALAVVLALSGPLVAPVVLMVCLLIGWSGLGQFSKIANTNFLPLVFFGVLCIYSLYLGTFNVEGEAATVPIWERYARLPEGIFNQISLRLGLPLLLGLVAINAVFLKKQKSEDATRILKILKWLALFCLLFILLLPLGGYREYRPNIIRRDTILPVLLCLMFCFCLTTSFLLKNLPQKFRKWYAAVIVLVLAIYTAADINPKIFTQNQCERDALKQIAASSDKVVKLDADCTVLAWHKITAPEASEWNAHLLQIWGVTEEVKLYFQP